MKQSFLLSLSFGAIAFLVPCLPLAQGTFWQPTGGPIGTQIKCLLIRTDSLIGGDLNDGVFISTDQGGHWVHGGLQGIPVLAIVAHSNGTLFCGTSFHGIWYSADGGANWSQSGLPSFEVGSLVIDDSSYILAGTSVHGIYRSTDNGLSWLQHSSNPFDVKSIIISPRGDLFAAALGGVFRSRDNGRNWMQVSPLQSNGGFRALACDSDATIYAGFHLDGFFDCRVGVARSTNDGDDWSFAVFLTSPPSNCFDVLALVINQVGNILCGTVNGAMRSTNRGVDWQQANSGLPLPTTVLSLAVNAEGYVFAGTVGGGVYRTVQSTTSVTSSLDLNPKLFSLSQNYPNPANPTTTIEYYIGQSGLVTIKVFDLLGREIATLVNESQPPGKHSIRWDASTLPSSVYFYRLITGSFVETKRVVLIR